MASEKDDKTKAKPEQWLADHGWTVDPVRTTLELQTDYGHIPPDVDVQIDSFMQSRYIAAIR